MNIRLVSAFLNVVGLFLVQGAHRQVGYFGENLWFVSVLPVTLGWPSGVISSYSVPLVWDPVKGWHVRVHDV